MPSAYLIGHCGATQTILVEKVEFLERNMVSGGGSRALGVRRRNERPFKGIRMRKWGKWVAEVREPNKRSRIWLGSYCTAYAAARAYDTAVYLLRGPDAKLNYPEEIADIDVVAGLLIDLTPAAIRQKAVEVGVRVDALHANRGAVAAPGAVAGNGHAEGNNEAARPGIDLNRKPEPED